MEEQNKSDKKWYDTPVTVLLVILFSPVILMAFLFVGVIMLKDFITKPFRKRIYKRSAYFRDLGLPFRGHPEKDPAYRFYNEASEKGIPFIFAHQPDNGLEYLVRDGKVFLFPWFEEMAFVDTDADAGWMIYPDDPITDGTQTFDKALTAHRAKLDAIHADLPCVVMITDAYLAPRNFDEEAEPDRGLLPEGVVWGKDFLTAYLGKDAASV